MAQGPFSCAVHHSIKIRNYSPFLRCQIWWWFLFQRLTLFWFPAMAAIQNLKGKWCILFNGNLLDSAKFVLCVFCRCSCLRFLVRFHSIYPEIKHKQTIFNPYHSPGSFSSRQIDDNFLIFSQKTGFDIGDNLHGMSKPQEKEKNISICCLLKILPRVLSFK